MKKAIIVFIAVVLGLFAMVGSSYAMEAELLWGDVYPDTIMGMQYYFMQRNDTVVTDSQGNVYFGGLRGSDPGWYSKGKYYIRKYDPSGNLLWHRTYYSEYIPEQRLNQVFLGVDGQDNLYFAGRYSYYPQSGNRIKSAVVLKYSPDGDLLWEYVPQSESFLYILNVVGFKVDSEGNACLLSELSANGYGYRIDKIDTNGNIIWVDQRKSAGYTPFDFSYMPSFLTIAPDGSALVTMWEGRMVTYDTSGTVTILGTVMPYPDYQIQSAAVDLSGNIYAAVTSLVPGLYGSYELAEPFIAKFDPAGNLLWMNDALFPGPSISEVHVAPDGNIVFVSSGADRNGNYEPNSIEPAVVSKYNPLGNLIWSQNIDIGTYRDIASTIVGPDGSIYVTGSTDIDGKIKAYAMKFSSSGDPVWEAARIAVLFGYPFSTHYDYPRSSALDVSGNLVVSGSLYSSNIPPGLTVYYREGHFVAKFGPSNSPPVADAGADQRVECGSAVTLDGSGSSDPDGDTLTYTWSGPFGNIEVVTATVTLPLGTHTVTLTVDDGNGGTSSDDVFITVKDTTPPVVTAGLSGTELQPGLYLSDVLYEMNATDSCSGVAKVSYTLDGLQTIVTGSYASYTISTGGEHIISFDATDYAGNTSASDDLSFTLFEATADGLSGLADYFISQGLISSQMETSLKQQAVNGSYQAFINHVKAQSGKKIDPAAAQILIQAAQYIMAQ